MSILKVYFFDVGCYLITYIAVGYLKSKGSLNFTCLLLVGTNLFGSSFMSNPLYKLEITEDCEDLPLLRKKGVYIM